MIAISPEVSQKLAELERRIEMLEEKDPRIPKPGYKNLFQIYSELNGNIPFYARRRSWSQDSSVKITFIELKGDYGKAKGIFHRFGEPTEKEPQWVSCAGCIQWELLNHEEVEG